MPSRELQTIQIDMIMIDMIMIDIWLVDGVNQTINVDHDWILVSQSIDSLSKKIYDKLPLRQYSSTRLLSKLNHKIIMRCLLISHHKMIIAMSFCRRDAYLVVVG